MDNLIHTTLPASAGFDPKALKIAKLCKASGGRAFFVGGCVRDSVLGLHPSDTDIEVYGMSADALYKALTSEFQVQLVGASFGVFKISGHDIDVSIPRTENKIGKKHSDFQVSVQPEIPFREAAERRDFTINSIMYDPLSNELIDPWNGLSDLKNGVLRHVSEKFQEDPLRVLRAMQFISRFELTAAPETVAVCRSMSQEGLSRERLAGEWEKMLLKGTRMAEALRFLRNCGWLKWYPELESLVECPQDTVHHPEGSVWEHTILAADHIPCVRRGVKSDDLAVAVSVLCHDFGKPSTTKKLPDGRIISYMHEISADDQISSFIQRLWNMQDLKTLVLRLVRAHMRPVSLVVAKASDKAYRKLAAEVMRPDLLSDLVECDLSASGKGIAKNMELVSEFRSILARLSIGSAPPVPFVTGAHVIERGISQGPEVGEILRTLYDAQLAGKFTDLDGAIKYLDKVIATRKKQSSLT